MHAELDSITHKLISEKIEIVEDTTVPPPCDIIFYQSGRMEYCKIIATDATTVSYKTCDRPDGLTIVVNKSTIHKLKYGNGKEEIINEKRKGKPHKSRNVLAVMSLIIGIVGIATVFLFSFVLLGLALTGLILGIAAFIEIRKSRKKDDEEKGMSLALWGILLNALVMALVALIYI